MGVRIKPDFALYPMTNYLYLN